MGEYFPAVIRIGGPMDWEQFRTAIESMNITVAKNPDAVPDEHEGDIWTDNILYSSAAKGGGRHFIFADSQASYGQFTDLEDFLQDEGISFDRHSDAHYEYDGEIRYWRPGMVTADSIPATQGGDALIRVDLLTDLIEKLGNLERVHVFKDHLIQMGYIIPPLPYVEFP